MANLTPDHKRRLQQALRDVLAAEAVAAIIDAAASQSYVDTAVDSVQAFPAGTAPSQLEFNESYTSVAWGEGPALVMTNDYVSPGNNFPMQIGSKDETVADAFTRDVNIQTGSINADNATLYSGAINIQTGFNSNTGSTGTTGTLYLGTGNTRSGQPGDVVLDPGTAQGDATKKGKVRIQQLLTLSAAVRYKAATISADTTLNALNNHIIAVNHSAPVAITLPAGVSGQEFVIIDVANVAGTHNITVSASGADTFIGGGASVSISSNGGKLRLVFAGSKWCSI